MNEKGLRVLTYNIHKGFNASNRRFVLHQIREALIAADADLLFLQEMQGEHQRHEKKVVDWPVLSQIEFIAEDTWPFHAYGKNAIYNAGHHGNAILSKFPFEHWENINVSPFPWASRSLLHGVIRLLGMAAETAPGSPRHFLPPWRSEESQAVGNRCDRLPQSSQDVHVVCIHFGLMGKERRVQISKLSDHIDSHVPHDAPLIVAGDFNDWLGQAEHLFHDHLGLQEVFRETHGRYARTFPSWMPFLPMDRIYYRGLIPVSCERLTHAPWHMLSDHAPLTASFTL